MIKYYHLFFYYLINKGVTVKKKKKKKIPPLVVTIDWKELRKELKLKRFIRSIPFSYNRPTGKIMAALAGK